MSTTSMNCENLCGVFESMDVIDFDEFREKINESIVNSKDYTEWAEHLEKILGKLKPNLKICEILMDLAITDKDKTVYCVDFSSRLCSISDEYRRLYEQTFQNMYETAAQEEPKQNYHRMYEEINFFALLFKRDSISWNVLSCIKLQPKTTFFKEYFIILLFVEIVRALGDVNLLYARLRDPNLRRNLTGLFPTDKYENTIYAIEIFKLINLEEFVQELQAYVDSLKDC